MTKKTGIVNFEEALDPKKNERNFFDTPNSPTLDLMSKGISNSENLGLMVSRQKGISHSSENSARQLELFETDNHNKIRIVQHTESYTTEITFIFSQLEKGLPQPAKKLLRFLMTKINEQAFSNHEMKRDFVQFPLQELVDQGLYGNLDTARRGFKTGAESLLTILVQGERTEGKGKNKAKYEWMLGHLFNKAMIKNGTCLVTLETGSDWRFIISQYQIMPNYSYQLSNRTFDLAESIFYLARVNCKEIAKTGKLNISFKVIQQRLAIPEASNYPGRDIKGPIINAVNELNEKEKGTKDFTIETVCDNNLPINEWIDKGYITVTFFNQYLEKYKDMAQRKALKIQEAIEKKAGKQ